MLVTIGASLLWGVAATWTAANRTSAANDMMAVTGPLSFYAQQVYQSLSDADATEAAAFLAVTEPAAAREEFSGWKRPWPDRPARTIPLPLRARPGGGSGPDRGISADHASFTASASHGDGALSGPATGMFAASLLMAAVCAWGLAQRIAEYR